MCQKTRDVDDNKVAAFAKSFFDHPDLKAIATEYDESALMALVSEFARTGISSKYKKTEHRLKMEPLLARAQAAGTFSSAGHPLACMVYVKFQRRYGASKAVCLR